MSWWAVNSGACWKGTVGPGHCLPWVRGPGACGNAPQNLGLGGRAARSWRQGHSQDSAVSPQRQEPERRGCLEKLWFGHGGFEEPVGKGTVVRGVQGLGDHLGQEVEPGAPTCVYVCACACAHACMRTHTHRRGRRKEGRFIYEQDKLTQAP